MSEPKPFRPSRTGDDGSTSFTKHRISKASPVIKLIGMLDSLQASLADALYIVKRDMTYWTYFFDYKYYQKLMVTSEILHHLVLRMYQIMGCIYNETDIPKLYNDELDNYLGRMPFQQQRGFILPIASEVMTKINLARTTTREAELQFHYSKDCLAESNLNIGIFLNRLSSVLYAAMIYCT